MGLPTGVFYHALPPEINTARLMFGAGPVPMLQAAAALEAMAIELETQADELAGSLTGLTASWEGSASETAVQSVMPMVIWLRTVSAQLIKRGLQATAQATAYSTALATTPPIPEIEENHITHGVLEATNFLGVNTVPIGANEIDYFVRMWNQAAGAMDAYQAETLLNTLFEPIMPMKPIVIPGVGESALATGVAQTFAQAPASALREATFTHVTTQATVESVALKTGQGAAVVNHGATTAESQAQRGENQAQQANELNQQSMSQGSQMMSQLTSTLTQIPQQASQMLQSPMQQMQQLTQPLQQVSQMFGQLGSSNSAQTGLMGASPFSNHPLAGGSGASTGAGMVRAASLPGSGGMTTRTPLLAERLGHDMGSPPAAVGAGAGLTTAGVAPVSSASGAGGAGMGMGHMGQRGTSGGNRDGLVAPAPLNHDMGDDDDDW